jgi:hypothetical protein
MRARAVRRSPESPNHQLPAGLTRRPFPIQAKRDSASLPEKGQAEIDQSEEKVAELGASFSNVRVFPKSQLATATPYPQRYARKWRLLFMPTFRTCGCTRERQMPNL